MSIWIQLFLSICIRFQSKYAGKDAFLQILDALNFNTHDGQYGDIVWQQRGLNCEGLKLYLTLRKISAKIEGVEEEEFCTRMTYCK